MSLVFDIGQGAGLAGATGVRPFLPPLLAGALARGDIGLDFSHAGTWKFLESPGFLLVVLALAVVAYLLDRSDIDRRSVTLGLSAVAVVIGALLFAGSLAENGDSAVIGIVAGAVCAALGAAAVGGFLARVAGRLDEGASGLLVVYADVAALVLAAIAIFVPPVAFLALIAFVVLLVRGRAGDDGKYAGLRILR